MNTVQKGELYFLLHPGEAQFSGYGLTMQPGALSPLVGLLMVDRPQPASVTWLGQVRERFGEAELVRMTRSGERGLACQMWIGEDSLTHVRPLAGAQTHALQSALSPLLMTPPSPQLDVHWDGTAKLWRSAFHAPTAVPATTEPAPPRRPRFPLGQVVITPGARLALTEAGQLPQEFLHRHVRGDWGELDAQDVQANEEALHHGHRLFSAYTTKAETRIWVITEYDRSVTTLLLPSEY